MHKQDLSQFLSKATCFSEQLVHRINNTLIFCFISDICFRQSTFNCFECKEIHPLNLCMLILIQLSSDVLSGKAAHSPFSSLKRLTELSHQLSFHISTTSIPDRSTVLAVVWTGKTTVKWLWIDLIFIACFPPFPLAGTREEHALRRILTFPLSHEHNVNQQTPKNIIKLTQD